MSHKKGTNQKLKGKISAEKKKLKTGEKENGIKNGVGVGIRFPKELQRKINAEKNPQEVIEKALAEYYSDTRLRNENAFQKEIDNNIIEIQRRHISDLKEQLSASNKNYEELMKTYQAYMFQVQPLIEKARLLEKEEIKVLEKQKEKEEIKTQTATKTEAKAQTAPQQKTPSSQTTTQTAEQPAAARTAPPSATPTAPLNEEKKKKWYEFWK